MPGKIACLALLLVTISSLDRNADFLLFAFTVQQSSLATGAVPATPGVPFTQNKRTSEYERRAFRRQHFDNARKALLDKNVPFDPEDLLNDDWPKNLKPVLDGMPEMQQVRRETAPLKGAYIADTLYLPERVELADHTVILARNVVFEGKNPIIRGAFDLHFFPMQPPAVLGTTLARALRKKASVLEVAFKGKPWSLPSFSLISDVADQDPHRITFDTSGFDGDFRRHPINPPPAGIKAASWGRVLPVSFQQNSDCSTGCDKSGSSQGPGSTGLPGKAGAVGVSPLKSPNGNCSDVANESNDGVRGDDATDGQEGGTGGTGVNGRDGGNAGNIDAFVIDGDLNQYTFLANGGTGGDGGHGGTGGLGGNGGKGGDGGDGVACSCFVGRGGTAGLGGTGGKGGKGGNGGNGGNGGLPGTIAVSLPAGSPGATCSNSGGLGGVGGPAGLGNTGGQGGNPGNPGKGGVACNQVGPTGQGNSVGQSGPTGDNGDAEGQNGTSQSNGPTPVITFRNQQTAGGGIGGIDPCLGGSGSDGSSFSPGRTADPTCSPIIIDTEGEGFHLTSASEGVKFDIAGNGHPVQIAWTAVGFHNAFLALPGEDGLVHNGKELFGNFTPQPPSKSPNGFLALSEFDKPENGGNGDGIIDEHDAVYSRLRLWIDENHDGISQSNELYTLPELGVFSLSLNYYQARREDQFGNEFRYKAKINPGRHDKRDEASEVGRWTYDVFFVIAK